MSHDEPSPGPQPCFLSTRWSVVLAAGRAETTQARQALAALCQTYWYPLYAYVRRQGHDAHDAQDLTQEFFLRLLEHHWLAEVSREKGRFRSFLMAAMNHFLANEWDRVRAKKRGGDRQFLPLDAESAETRYRLEPADATTPEVIFERRWALTLLDQVMARLQAEFAAEGQAAVFEQLKFALTGDRSAAPYAELAARLHQSEGAVKVAVHRLRQRYRDLLRAEIAQTVDGPPEVEAELRHLIRVLSG
jgi:RNA polymerase sigma factor (sigma-70 family)